MSERAYGNVVKLGAERTPGNCDTASVQKSGEESMRSEGNAIGVHYTAALTIAKRWGWELPPPHVISVAERAIKFESIHVGEALVDLKLISKDQLVVLVRSQPTGVKMLQHAAESYPEIRSSIDKVLTLKQKLPFYEDFIGMTIHPVMQSDKIISAKCHTLDAILMMIEGKTPVLVFSELSKLTDYTQAGRPAKSQDVIRNHDAIGVKDDILCAVARIDLVTQLLAEVDHHKSGKQDNQENILHASTAPDENLKQCFRAFDYAILKGASDISIEPNRAGGAKIFMRRNTDMYEVPGGTFQHEGYEKVINYLLSKSGSNKSGTRIFEPRDGQITYQSGAGSVFLRLSFIPLGHTSNIDLISVSIRIFARTESVIRLQDLNLHPVVQNEIESYVQFPKGLILLVGGTNTGKSTTIAGALGEHHVIYGTRKKRLSIEQPIERFLKGVTQINASHNPGGGEVDLFDLNLRAIKRHDPDLIWIGEIRDEQSANVCVTSATSGHLVMSTIHANHCILGFDTLSKYVSANRGFQLVESLLLIVAQTLVPELCPDCREIGRPTKHEELKFQKYCQQNGIELRNLPTSVARRHEGGCEECGFTGHVGMLPVNEVLPITDPARDLMIDLLNNKNSRTELNKHRSLTMLECSFEYLQRHMIDVGSVIT